MLKVSYEEIIENWNNSEWQGWNTVRQILNTIGYSYEKDDKKRVINFVKNYLVEKSFIESYKDYDYYSEDDLHEYFHEGNGSKNPDFLLNTGNRFVSAELKSVERISFDLLYKFNYRWHGAEQKLFFSKNDKAVYQLNKNNEFILMRNFNLDKRYYKLTA